jgi:hypothetical protein
MANKTMPTDTNATDPSNYRPHPMGYACLDCNAAASLGQAVRHSARCDIAPREFVLPADQAAGPSSKRAERRGTAPNSLRAAAKRGDARIYFADADISLAVRNGEISESDAMNQDF